MMRANSLMVLLGWLVLVSCSAGKSMTGTPAAPSVAGTWEFLAVSNNGGGTTGIEVALDSSPLICWTCPVEPAGALTQTLFGNQPL
jgi:hypothetical protein